MSRVGVGRGPSRRWWRHLAMALVAAVAVAAASVEPARRALSRAEPYVPFVLLALGLVSAAAARLPRRMPAPARRLLRLHGARLVGHLARHGLVLAIVAFLAPVWAARDLRPPGVTSAYAALFGRIPWSDAGNYHAGALRLLDRGTLDGFNERRPVNAALLAVRLASAGESLGAATILQAGAAGVAAWLAAASVAARFGAPSAVLFLGVALGLVRPYLATALSETLGFTLGCVAVALLMAGARGGASRWVLPAGVFGLALAQSVRPGAVLVVPLVVVAAVAAARRRGVALASLTAAALLAASVPLAVLRLHGSAGAQLQSNFASIALALASGESGWKAVLEAREGKLAGLDESAAARALYAEAWEQVRRHPGRFLAGLYRGTQSYVKELPEHAAQAVALPQARWPAAVLLAVALAMAFAALAGGPAGLAWLWAAAAAGTLLSAPFVHEAGGMRVFVTTDVLLAAFLASGAARRGTPALGGLADAARGEPIAHGRAAAAVLALAVAAALLGPTVARAVERRPAPLPPPAEGAIVRGRPIAVVVDPSLASPCAGVKVVTRRAFRQGLDLTGEAERLATRRPPFAFVAAYDPGRGVDRYLVSPVALACADADFLHVRTRPFLDSRLVEEVVSFEPLSRR